MSNLSIDVRDHMVAVPSEDSSDPTRGLCWVKERRNALADKYPNGVQVKDRNGNAYLKTFTRYKDNAPVVKCMMTFTAEELRQYLAVAEAKGVIKLEVAYWDSKYPETSDGFTKECPKEDDYRPSNKQAEPQQQSTVIVPDVIVA